MKSENIKIANIYRKTTTYEPQNQIVVEARNGKYVKLEETKKLFVKLGLLFESMQNHHFLETIDGYEHKESTRFVNDLKPYITTCTSVSLKQARKRNN